MPQITYREAIRHALAEELERDANVVVMGEEVAQFNGAYKVTEGLLAKFGRSASWILPSAKPASSAWASALRCSGCVR